MPKCVLAAMNEATIIPQSAAASRDEGYHITYRASTVKEACPTPNSKP